MGRSGSFFEQLKMPVCDEMLDLRGRGRKREREREREEKKEREREKTNTKRKREKKERYTERERELYRSGLFDLYGVLVCLSQYWCIWDVNEIKQIL